MKTIVCRAVLISMVVGMGLPITSLAQTGELNAPPGSERFGTAVVPLPNGNVVITDPYYDAGSVTDVGAVYLFDGATGAMLSMITGSRAGDQVGSSVLVLANGNFVIVSPYWDNGTATNAGAVTWGSRTSGVSGSVSASNSLVGSTSNDGVGNVGVRALPNGNYVVRSPGWDRGAIADAGAVTWGNGTFGISGAVTVSNSLVGSVAGDSVGGGGITALANGSYVVRSSTWDNGAVVDVGAVTWVDGTVGRTGTISATNSLIGSTAYDYVGAYGVTELPNGNYVVRSASWDRSGIVDAGAVTWGSGTAGISGTVSTANSLVGSTAGDFVGGSGVTVLANGHYVVRSADWDNQGITDAGAVTWANGITGLVGSVSQANSLVGSRASDFVGSSGVTPLTNGNYVVRSSNWDNGTVVNAGAATWASGTTGITGMISSTNSLVGTKADDFVGAYGVTPLANGNYVVISSSWDNAAAIDAGAVTWGNGTVGVKGAVSATNSLVGSRSSDFAGAYGVTALTNGNYVVLSANWDRGTTVDAGAVTFGNGATGISGAISATNSLVGSQTGDLVGNGGATALTNGNYVVSSPDWDRGTIVDAGAATWCQGTTGVAGSVSATNSLVGSTAGDYVSAFGIEALSNGNYVVNSSEWDNGVVLDAGAVTWANGGTGIAGPVSAANSLVGSSTRDLIGSGGTTALENGNYAVRSPSVDNGAIPDAGAVSYLNGETGSYGFSAALVTRENGKSESNSRDIAGYTPDTTNSVFGSTANWGSSLNFAHDYVNTQLVVGRPYDNTVTFFQRFAPTASTVFVEGRIENAFGRGINGAVIEATSLEGEIRTARSNNFGYFRVEELTAGETYVFTVIAKGHSFQSVVMQVTEDIQGLTFTAQAK